MPKRVATLLFVVVILILGSWSVDAEYEDCLLPKVVGPCRAAVPSWYYKSSTDECVKFTYGGCNANSNNFETKQLCEDACKNVCEQEQWVGHCRAAIPKYFFNSETGSCEEFIYGGCGGNGNNFKTLELCESTCENKKR